jgi:hypothetical protein
LVEEELANVMELLTHGLPPLPVEGDRSRITSEHPPTTLEALIDTVGITGEVGAPIEIPLPSTEPVSEEEQGEEGDMHAVRSLFASKRRPSPGLMHEVVFE